MNCPPPKKKKKKRKELQTTTEITFFSGPESFSFVKIDSGSRDIKLVKLIISYANLCKVVYD